MNLHWLWEQDQQMDFYTLRPPSNVLWRIPRVPYQLVCCHKNTHNLNMVNIFLFEFFWVLFLCISHVPYVLVFINIYIVLFGDDWINLQHIYGHKINWSHWSCHDGIPLVLIMKQPDNACCSMSVSLFIFGLTL